MPKIELIQGDCLEKMKNIPDGSIDMILCDLPYGTTRNKWDSVIPLGLMWNEYDRIIKDNGAIVLTAQTPFDKILGTSKIEFLKYEWIWIKQQGTGFLNSKKMPLKATENILVFYKNPPIYNPQMRTGFKPYTCKSGKGSNNYGKQIQVVTESNGDRFPLNWIEVAYDKEKLHPTQKPVALMEYLIKTYTNEGDTVLDNCMGSGTTGVACKNLNRNFIGIELDPEYFKIAEKRINENRNGIFTS
jgi:site-specific DNA-methyltransferase (adenine-specific)